MKTNYQLNLKGYVGGWDFDRGYVDYVLAQNKDKHVDVLIDSLGGSLATALSIASAFRNHGDVHVHFVGMNASAATIASLGAKHISMDASAMYLVHQCSMEFFEWASMNASQLQDMMNKVSQMKTDLEKLDANIADMYSSKCKKKPEDLMALMKVGGWLNSKDVLEWGFVDEITDYEDEQAPVLTDAVASAMASAGIPIPNIPTEDSTSAFGRFLQSIASLFKGPNNAQASNEPKQNFIPTVMNKTFKFICQVLTLQSLAITDGKASLSEEQVNALETAFADKEADLAAKTQALEDREKAFKEANDKVAAHEATIKDLEAKVTALETEVTALKKEPAASSAQVVNNKGGANLPEEKTVEEEYIETVNSANSLYDMLP